MKTPIPMPVLSDTMTTGRLSTWNKKPGDPVRTGESLATMESDKAVMDIEAFSDGFLSGPLAEPGVDIPVGTTIGFLCDTRDECEPGGPPAHPSPPPAPVHSPDRPVVPAAEPARPPVPIPPPPAPGPSPDRPDRIDGEKLAHPSAPSLPGPAPSRVPASPYARGLAQDLEIDLTLLPPGRDGYIRASQVLERALGQSGPDLSFSPPHTLRAPSTMEASIARNLVQSASTPVFHLAGRTSLQRLSESAKSSGISLTLALVKASALAICEHPRFKSLWTRQGVLLRERIDVGVAVDTGEGLVTPVIRDVAGRSLPEIAEDWRILKEKAGLGRLVPGDYLGGTFYISNLGTIPEVESFDAMLPSTASAILAVSAPSGSDQKTTLTLTCDHRTIYGAHAARYLSTLTRLLGEPAEWISEKR